MKVIGKEPAAKLDEFLVKCERGGGGLEFQEVSKSFKGFQGVRWGLKGF